MTTRTPPSSPMRVGSGERGGATTRTPTPTRRSPRAAVAAAVVRPDPAGPETSSRCGPASKKSMPTTSTSGPPTPSGSQVSDGGGSGRASSSRSTRAGSGGNGRGNRPAVTAGVTTGSPSVAGSVGDNRVVTWSMSVSASTSGRQIWTCAPLAASAARPGTAGGLATPDGRCARRSSSLPNGRSRRRVNRADTLLVSSS